MQIATSFHREIKILTWIITVLIKSYVNFTDVIHSAVQTKQNKRKETQQKCCIQSIPCCIIVP